MSPDKNNFSLTSPISESYCLPNGALRIASFLRLIQEVSIGGSAFLGEGVETLKAKNLYWVVMSYHFEVTRWPLANETITIETFPGVTKAFIYPRHYIVYDEKGAIIVRGISLWAVLDHASHKPTIPPANGVDIAAIHEEGELSWPPRQVLEDLSVKELRLVRNSDLDFNGHMNNIRYVDFALDSDDFAFYSSHIPTEFQMTFSSETTLGKTMEIASKLSEEKRDYQGRVEGKPVFSLSVMFKK
jgi:medium-chain acyl-[acyl-carrier-protein] hydrolase